jgi:hypothetical protein
LFPGLGDSGETHLQNYWLQHFETSQKSSSEGIGTILSLKDWLELKLFNRIWRIIIIAPALPAH